MSMSTLLLTKMGVKIAGGSLPSAVCTQFKGWFETAGWQVLAHTTTTLDLQPPASQSVGNGLGSDVLRLEFTPTTIGMLPLVKTNVEVKRSYHLWYSNNQNGMTYTIGGTQVVQDGTYSTEDERLAALHNTLSTSTDAEVQKYDYRLEEIPSSTNNYDRIWATEKVVNTGGDIVGSYYANTRVITNPQVAGVIADRGVGVQSNARSMTINYGQEWVVYCSITERSFNLAVKSTTNFLGPINAAFAPHDDAIRQCPDGCYPAELVLIYTGNFSGRVSGYNGTFGTLYGHRPVEHNSAPSSEALTLEGHGLLERSYKPKNFSPKRRITPNCLIAGVYDHSYTQRAFPEDVKLGPIKVWPASYSGYDFQAASPSYLLEDVNAYLYDGGQEIMDATKSATSSTLAAAITPASAVITLADAASFPDAGSVLIGSEVVNYSSKSGNNLQGCTRAKANSQAAPHASGAEATLVNWWVRINQGAIFAGHRDPSEAV